MIFRKPAFVTKNLSTSSAYIGQSRQFATTVFTVVTMNFMMVVMIPGTVMIFGKVMIPAENVSAPVAFERDFIKYFPAIVTSVHYA